MPYGTTADLRIRLDQVKSDATTDAKLAEALKVASALCDGELGFSFAGYDAQASARALESSGGKYVHLPYHELGSLTGISLVALDVGRGQPCYLSFVGPSTALAFTDYQAEADDHTFLWRYGGWYAGRYEATAKWGYGLPPDDYLEIVYEFAVNWFRSSSRGMFGDAVGQEGGGAVSPARLFTWGQKDALARIRTRYTGGIHFA